jgi:hypothetical protein
MQIKFLDGTERTTWLGSRLNTRRDCTDIQPVASAIAVVSIVDRKQAQANGKGAKINAGRSICHASLSDDLHCVAGLCCVLATGALSFPGIARPGREFRFA